MSISTSLEFINNYLKENKDTITKEVYKNSNLVTPTSTLILEGTIINCSIDIKVIFCSYCSINLTSTNYIKHLKTRHSTLLKEYKNTNKYINLVNKIETLEFNTFEDLKDIIEPNSYYFKDLPLILDFYKCYNCSFINLDRKNIRKHYNNKHTKQSINSKVKADYIIEGVPV